MPGVMVISVCRVSASSILLMLAAVVAQAQHLVTGASPDTPPVFRQQIVTAFDSGEALHELPCSVSPQKPSLAFDLTFHAGYAITLSLDEMEGAGNTLVVLSRVTPVDRSRQPMYFEERFRMPASDGHLRGSVVIPGQFAMGAGSYKVDVLLRDDSERYCSGSFELTASLSGKDKSVVPALVQGEVAALDRDVFLPESIERKAEASGLKVRVLANFVPRSATSSSINPADTEALVSMLRNINRNPRVGSISLVAFNLYEERVLFRQDNTERIDFPGLGKSLGTLNPGTVSFDQLNNKNSSAEFLAELVKDSTSGSHPDAIVFIGPKAFVEGQLPKDELSLNCPIFYLNYVDNPQAAPWRDTVGRLVKLMRGFEFSVTGPRDLWNSVSEVVSRSFAVRSSALSAGTNANQ